MLLSVNEKEVMTFRRSLILLCRILLCVCIICFTYLLFERRIYTHTSFNEILLKPTASSCSPKHNIFFLKTHKSAGTAIQNILLRYANAHNLTVALPPSSHMFNNPFPHEAVASAPWAVFGYNVLCHHMIYNDVAVRSVMPRDTIYITILRDPVSAFESLYEYSNYRELFNLTVEDFAHATLNSTRMKRLQSRLSHDALFQNMMLHDLGYNNSVSLPEFVESLDKQFHFVMINEYFDDSLVLLRHRLCWSDDDVIGFSVNSRSSGFRWRLSRKARERLEDWNSGDSYLYTHFVRKFAHERELYGKRRMERDVQKLRSKRRLWYNYCIDSVIPSSKSTRHKFWTPKVLAFKLRVKNKTCDAMVKPEREQTEDVRQRQMIRAMVQH